MTLVVETTVTAVQRLQNSVSGNPRWRVTTADGLFYTRRDSQVSFSVEGLSAGEAVSLTLRAGEIVGLERLPVS